MLPRQQVPESEKTESWCRDTVNAVRRMIDAQGSLSQRTMAACYNILNGYQDAADFEYLTGSGDLTMPAKIRFLPVIRPYFDILTSIMESRPLEPEVYAVDTDSLEDKNDEVARNLVGRFLSDLGDRRNAILQQQQQVELVRQRVQMQSQQAQQQGIQMDPAQMLSVAALDLKLQQMTDMFVRGEGVINERVEQWEREYQYGYRTSREVKMSRGLEYLIAKYDLRAKFSEGLRDIYTVDNAIYALDDIMEGRDPVLRKVSPMDLFHSGESGVRYLRDCSWVAERQYLSINQVLDEFGGDLSDEQVSALGSESPLWPNAGRYDVSMGQSGMTGLGSDCDTGLYSGVYPSQGTIEVIRVSWLSSRKVHWKECLNKHDSDKPFIKLISDEEVGRKPRKGEKYRCGYVTDRYTGVCIAGKHYVRLGKAALQIRDVDDYSTAHHPYAGYAYNDTDNRPYSRIWAVKDIQVLYNLMYYQLELLVTMGGIKAFIMDKAQLPKDMSPEEFMYNMKQGVIYIDSSRPGASGRPTNFNQFPTIDLTFGNSVAQTLGILDRLEQLSGRIIGISPQRMGDVGTEALAGPTNAAIQQSTQTTEVLFYKMSRIQKQAIDMLLYAIPFAWKEGKRGQYILGKYGQRIISVSKGELGSARYECHFPDRGAEQSKLQNALQMLSSSGAIGQMPMSQLISLYDANGIHELEQTLKSYEKLAAQKQQEGQEFQAQHEKEIAQLDAQSAQQLKALESGGEKLKAQVDQMRIQLDAQLAQLDAQTRMGVANVGAGAQQYKADSESAVEREYLEEQRREHDIETELAMAQMQIDGSKENNRLSSTPQKQRVR